jgi:hypothetical protein
MKRLGFGVENGWHRISVALTKDHNHFALAGLIAQRVTIAAVFFHVGWLGCHTAAEDEWSEHRQLARLPID